MPIAQFEAFNMERHFNGAQGVYVSGNLLVVDGPAVVYRIRCTAAGTIKLWDNTAGSGDVLLDTVAMTANQTIELGMQAALGIYATRTSGTFCVICSGDFNG